VVLVSINFRCTSLTCEAFPTSRGPGEPMRVAYRSMGCLLARDHVTKCPLLARIAAYGMNEKRLTYRWTEAG
jgi:hypothetical protein